MKTWDCITFLLSESNNQCNKKKSKGSKRNQPSLPLPTFPESFASLADCEDEKVVCCHVVYYRKSSESQSTLLESTEVAVLQYILLGCLPGVDLSDLPRAAVLFEAYSNLAVFQKSVRTHEQTFSVLQSSKVNSNKLKSNKKL